MFNKDVITEIGKVIAAQGLDTDVDGIPGAVIKESEVMVIQLIRSK